MTESAKRSSLVIGSLLLLVAIILMFFVSPALQSKAMEWNSQGNPHNYIPGDAMAMQEKAQMAMTAGYLSGALGLVFLLAGLIGQTTAGPQAKPGNGTEHHIAQTNSKKKVCTKCSHNNQPDSRFCSNCGAELTITESKDL